jgi:hypothetical protein
MRAALLAVASYLEALVGKGDLGLFSFHDGNATNSTLLTSVKAIIVAANTEGAVGARVSRSGGYPGSLDRWMTG